MRGQKLTCTGNRPCGKTLLLPHTVGSFETQRCCCTRRWLDGLIYFVASCWLAVSCDLLSFLSYRALSLYIYVSDKHFLFFFFPIIITVFFLLFSLLSQNGLPTKNHPPPPNNKIKICQNNKPSALPDR